MEFNLADIFESVADAIPDREAVIFGDLRLTYGELDARTTRLANFLKDQGIQPGEHLGIQMQNCNQYIETAIACLKVRAVPINVNYRYVEDELRYLYEDADLVGLFLSGAFADRAAAASAGNETMRLFVSVGDHEGAAPTGTIDYDEALAQGGTGRDFGPRSGDDHYIIYTGGTTGMPKGVVWRSEDIFFAGMGGGEPMGEAAKVPEDVARKVVDRGEMTMFPVAPLMHGAAQLASFIAFWGGQRVVYIQKFDAAGVVDLIAREKVNTINVVGDAMARPIAEEIERRQGATDLSSLFVISSAGAILSDAVKDKLTTLLPDVFIIDSFGATEVGFSGSATADSSPEKGLKFNVNDRTAVLDDNLEIVQPGSGVIGRVAQKGHVPLGYYNDEQKTKECFVEAHGQRWVLLGDMATVEEDGAIRVFGRGSVCINSGGEKIYPEEVEAALKAHDAVFDAVVAGVPDERFGERVGAIIQFRDDVPTPGLEEIEAHCRAKVADYKVPRVILPVDEMRRSPSGKADYPWARELLSESRS